MNTNNIISPAVTTLTIAAVIIFAPEIAFAQSSDEWVKPASDLIDALRSGLVTAGALIVGLAVVARGIWIAMSGNPEWQKIGMIIMGGVMIMAGPKVMAALLEVAQS
jgi:conjugal transfer pilus assembly protein TraA